MKRRRHTEDDATESTNARCAVRKPLGVVVYVSLTTGELHVRDADEFHGWVDTHTRRFVEVPA